MYFITMAALFSPVFAGFLEDVINGKPSVHDLLPEKMIEVLNALLEMGKTDLVMQLVDRSKDSPKREETIEAILAATDFCPGIVNLIGDFSVGIRIDDLDLNEETTGGKLLLTTAVS